MFENPAPVFASVCLAFLPLRRVCVVLAGLKLSLQTRLACNSATH